MAAPPLPAAQVQPPTEEEQPPPEGEEPPEGEDPPDDGDSPENDDPPVAAGTDADERPRIKANIFAGSSFDDFAAGELLQFLNEDDANDIRERFVGGFRINFRVGKEGHPWWVDIETSHGVRSASVNCKENPEIAVCKDIFDPATAGERVLFLIREASSLEGALRVRKEFKNWNVTNDPPNVAAYLVGHLGFLTVRNSGGDVVDNHHIGLGLALKQGDFKGSYVEIGHGKTDLFAERSDDRWKANATLRWSVAPEADSAFKDLFWIFARITVDADFGAGSDSIQSYFGVEVNAKKITGGGS